MTNSTVCNVFSEDLQKKIFEQIRSTPHEQPCFGTTFLNPLIIMKNNDSFKTVLDARPLKSNTDQSPDARPLELLATQPARANE